MKFLLSVIMLAALGLTGCAHLIDDGQVYVGAEAGPVDVAVAVDNNGNVSVSGGMAPKFKVGLGPVELKVGIQKTLELTKERPFTLFVIWEDENGEIQCEEYEIGKPFRVSFAQDELIQEIQGNNHSIIIVVRKPESLQPSSSMPMTQTLPQPSMLPTPPHALADSFVGKWFNENPQTDGITRVEIRRRLNDLIIHMWGQCHPTECDWGELITDISNVDDGVISITWEPGFAIKRQELTLTSDKRLQVITHTHFIDNSGRPDYDATYYFVRR